MLPHVSCPQNAVTRMGQENDEKMFFLVTGTGISL
jgi:hypothetical protein